MIWDIWILGNCRSLGARCEVSGGCWQIVGLEPDGTVVPRLPEECERMALIFTPDDSETFDLLFPVENAAQAFEIAAWFAGVAPAD